MTTFHHLRGRSGKVLQFLQPRNVPNNHGLFLRNEASFVPKRVLIVAKLSRFHFEKIREPDLTDEQLKLKLQERGSDYETMWASHAATENVRTQVIELLQKLNIEYKIITRHNLNAPNFKWADLILPIGGDGTFLLASNMMFDNEKPIMGINSYPERSEGFLMLPPKYTNRISEIFEKLRAGYYTVQMRSRIRTTIQGENIWDAPFHTHEKGRVAGGEKFYTEHLNEEIPSHVSNERRLPWLALNEVFVAETLSARTSSLLIKLDDEEKYQFVKSSGLCVSTGTGSTSWYKAITSISPQIVQEILNLVDNKRQLNSEEIEYICSTFNDSLPFNPEDLKLSYAIRDMIISNTLSESSSVHSRGFCHKLTVRSECYDAGIVLDGGIAVPFNFGSTAVMEIHPEDSLRSIILLD